MWFKLFDWLRLFKRTAIYPRLLTEVMYDVIECEIDKRLCVLDGHDFTIVRIKAKAKT